MRFELAMKRRSAIAVLLLLASVLLLGGCASAPAFTRVSAAPGARVGIVFLLSSPDIRNVHTGLTVFGNYDNTIANDWRLDQRALDATRQLLRQAGYEPVDVALDSAQAQAIRQQDDLTSLNYNGLTRDWTQTYTDILDKNNLAALVLLREEIRPIGERGPVLKGYGIVSAMGRVPSAAFLFVTATADVIGGKPPHRAIGTCYGAAPLDMALVHVDNFADIKLADLAPVREKFEALLDKRIRFELASSGLLPEAAQCVQPPAPAHR